MPPFTVFARAFGKSQESPRNEGEFPTYEAALTAAANRVLNDLFAVYDTKQNARELFDLWQSLGDDIFIVPDDETAPFSAVNFARLMVMQVTLDDSRPLVLEVTCTDQLNFPSGTASPSKQWVFWVKAPATYSGATPLIRRATESLYAEMSRTAMASEGSSYTLLDMTMRELSEAEVVQEKQASPRKTVFVVQGDGALVEEA